MRSLFFIAATVAMLSLGAMEHAALAQSYSGTTGVNSEGVTGTMPVAPAPQPQRQQQPTQAAPQALPPVFQGANAPNTPQAPVPAMPSTAPTAPSTPATPQAPAGQLDASALPSDPCAAYLSSYEYYAVCQDRVKRLERMQELKDKRIAEAEARKQEAADRKAAAEEARKQRAEKPKMRRPGQVEQKPKPPQRVEVVPVEDTKK